jgi:hypothetical protein
MRIQLFDECISGDPALKMNADPEPDSDNTFHFYTNYIAFLYFLGVLICLLAAFLPLILALFKPLGCGSGFETLSLGKFLNNFCSN